METRYFHILILVLCLSVQGWSGSRNGLTATPDAELIDHGAYQIHANLARASLDSGAGAYTSYPYYTGLRFGLFDRGEFGIEYGQELSLSGKVRFMDQGIYLPAVSFGTRQIFSSQEAYMYTLGDSLNALHRGEVYFAASRTIRKLGLSVHFGGSVFGQLDSGKANVFYGLDQAFPHGIHVNFEGFKRHDAYHHNFGAAWHYEDILVISAGFREVFSWFYQEESIGWHSEAGAGSETGFDAPGIYFKISLTGKMKERQKLGLEGRLERLERHQMRNSKGLDEMYVRMDHAETQLQELSATATDSIQKVEAQAEAYLNRILKEFESDTYDVMFVRSLMDSVMQLGDAAERVLIRMVRSEFVSSEHKENAIRVMAYRPKPRFLPVLIKVTQDENSEEVIKEAILALAKYPRSETQDILESFATHPSELLREASQEILQEDAKEDPAKSEKSDNKEQKEEGSNQLPAPDKKQ